MRGLGILILVLGFLLMELAGLLACCNLVGWTQLDTGFLLWLLLPGIMLMVVAMLGLSRYPPPTPRSPS